METLPYALLHMYKLEALDLLKWTNWKQTEGICWGGLQLKSYWRLVFPLHLVRWSSLPEKPENLQHSIHCKGAELTIPDLTIAKKSLGFLGGASTPFSIFKEISHSLGIRIEISDPSPGVSNPA